MRYPGFASADELQRYRTAAGWSQATLAEKSGVHVQTVKYHERQKGRIGGWAPQRFREAFENAGITAPKTPCKVAFLSAENSSNLTRPMCGAKTRKGTPCKARPIPGRARCKLHGGCSTGPKTAEGRARIVAAQRARWAAYAAERAGIIAEHATV